MDLKEPILVVDFEKDEAFELAGKGKVLRGDEKACENQIKELYHPENQRNFRCHTRITDFQSFVILLPIFVSSFMYDNTRFDVVISGNKGVVEGRRPYGSGMLGKMVTNSWKTLKTVYNDSL